MPLETSVKNLRFACYMYLIFKLMLKYADLFQNLTFKKILSVNILDPDQDLLYWS